MTYTEEFSAECEPSLLLWKQRNNWRLESLGQQG